MWKQFLLLCACIQNSRVACVSFEDNYGFFFSWGRLLICRNLNSIPFDIINVYFWGPALPEQILSHKHIGMGTYGAYFGFIIRNGTGEFIGDCKRCKR